MGMRREVFVRSGQCGAKGGRTHHRAHYGGYFAARLLMHQPRSCRHSTDPDDYVKQKKYPWTLILLADPRADTYDHKYLLRQLAVVAD